jgi:glucosyl-3-phosphoglycerate synthase
MVMATRRLFPSLRRALVPVIHGFGGLRAIEAARAVATEVVLVGLVRLTPDQPLSAGAVLARQVRARLKELDDIDNVRARGRVIVSHSPWDELRRIIDTEDPDLMVLDMDGQLEALGISAADILGSAPCDVAVVRGDVPHRPTHVLVPARGGPHAELALRIGLDLRPQHLTAMHLRAPGESGTTAAFRGLERVLARLPDVSKRSAVTERPADTILEEATELGADLIIMGAAARPSYDLASMGAIADRVMAESSCPVIVVKTRRPMAEAAPDETAGASAISILVDKWFAENTYHSDEFKDLERLVALKHEQGLTISLALPALNEEETVGNVIGAIQRELMHRVPLIDEMVLIDSQSIDRTREIAAEFGVPVHIHQEILPRLGARKGKGEALWKSLLVTRGDIVAWIDTDIVNIDPRFVYGIIGPLLLNPKVQLVKGFYQRPLRVGEKTQAGGGGRVTELTARPLLNLFYPELSGIVQPLSGEYAGRRSALEQIPFFSGYGVEIGMVIDMFDRFGVEGIAQVDLLERVHHNQELEALSKMSFAILQAVFRKLEGNDQRAFVADVNKTMKLIRYEAGSYFLDVEEIAERERPPILSLPEYTASRVAVAPDPSA